MGEDDKISTANYKKYTTILNEVIDGLTRIQRDLSESLQGGHRVDAKFKAAVVSLKCIDRKYRTLLFNEEPLCIQCTTEYLESKKKEREEGKEKLQAMRKEYYMQEEHMTKLSHTLQEAERELAMQSIKCTHEGLLVSRLLWSATKPRSILEKLTSECATQLNDFLNLAEGCIYAFAATYKNSMPDPCTDEYQYVISLCGILTNLSSIPEGRLFLMWNPFGRAIYTMGLDMMRAISGKATGSLKWMILIMVYNILVNPLGRKFILKHPLLRENLEGCLLPSNCADITGTALHIIKIYVDDFIDDNDMVSVLMYQLPLKQVYFLSNASSDINIRKIALAIVSRLKKKMLDCRRAVAVGTSLPSAKRRKQKKFVTASVMTSNMSLYTEYETEDTQYTNSETEISNASSRKKKITSKPLDSKPYTRKLSKKEPSINFCEEMCATPSLRAKGKNKITVKTLFKPSTSKSLNVSCVELRARSTGRLEGVPPLKQKSKSAELLSASQNKLMNVDRKTVISMLSKLDLDTYLRPSYDGFGIPLKNNDCPYCCKPTDRKVSKRTAVPTACACKKTTDKGKCDHLVCVCDEIAARQATRSKAAVKQFETPRDACLCINRSEEKGKRTEKQSESQQIEKSTNEAQAQGKEIAEDYNTRSEQKTEEICIRSKETEKSSKVQIKTATEVCLISDGKNSQIKSTETKKADKLPVSFKNEECCICSGDVKQTSVSKKVADANEACKCMNKTEGKGKCDKQVCVCAEIAERHARAQKGPWTPDRGKESKEFVEKNFNTTNDLEHGVCSQEVEKSFADKAEMCPEKTDAQVKSTQTKKAEKSPVQFESQACEDANAFKKVEDACACMNKTGEKGKCGQQVCVCAEISTRQAQAQKGPWTPRHTGKESKKSVDAQNAPSVTKSLCICSEKTEKASQVKLGSEDKGTQAKSPVRFEDQEDVSELKTTNNIKGAGEICECIGEEFVNISNSTQEICICSDKLDKRDEHVADAYLGPAKKTTQSETTEFKKANKFPKIENNNTCICSEDTNKQDIKVTGEACACRNKTAETGKCNQKLCVCAEIAARQAKAKKGEWVPRTKDKKTAEKETDNKISELLDEKCVCESDKLGETETVAPPKENAAVSFTNLHSSSDRNLSVHSKLVIRKSSGLRRKPKVSNTKVAEDRNFKWEDICSCPAKPKGDRTTCGDECETCMITLPVIDIAALANEPKNKEQETRADAGGDELVPCGCNPKERKTKTGEEHEQKADQPQAKAETEVKAEVGCPSKCKKKEVVVETGGKNEMMCKR